jgi:hypothetical protein
MQVSPTTIGDALKTMRASMSVTWRSRQHHPEPMSLLMATFALDACVNFSATDRTSMSSTCGAVVDYPFYLRSDLSLYNLEAEARGLLGKEEFLFLTTDCLANYKKLVCSNVYLKCQPGVVMSNTSTYNTKIYSNLGSYRVPFTRPCQQVCLVLWLTLSKRFITFIV